MDSFVDVTGEASKALDLSRIRFQLMQVTARTVIRLEDTITFFLIERVQFPHNETIYVPGALSIPRSELSFFDWYLLEQEKLQSLIRRFDSPDEIPFFPDAVQTPILRPLHYPKILHKNDVCVNDEIKRFYIESFLPVVCQDFGRQDRGEQQENYGSTATCDIACLQALSRRIHFGKFVAEVKFRSDPEGYTRMIKAGDVRGITESITDTAVEQQVLDRLRLKATTYGRDPSSRNGAEQPVKINVDAVVNLYRDYVIPLTKRVEIEYLMQRLEPEEQK